jgi:hypothetical protein
MGDLAPYVRIYNVINKVMEFLADAGLSEGNEGHFLQSCCYPVTMIKVDLPSNNCLNESL